MDALTPISATLAGALLGALATFLLSILKFRAEKRWEKRLEGYDTLIRSLHQCREFYAYRADILANPEKEEDEEKYRQLEKQEAEARRLIGFTLQGGLLVMGRKVHNILQDYILAISMARVESNDLLRAEKAKKVADDYLKRLIASAQGDSFL